VRDTDWQTLIRTSVQKTESAAEGEGRSATMLRLVAGAMAQHPDNFKAQMAATGLSKSALYRWREKALAATA
jgi:hypothetical protein